MLGSNSPGPLGRILAQSAVAVPLTGTASETTLATIAVPANAMGANGRIALEIRFSLTNNANAKTLKVKLGSTTLITSPTLTGVANAIMMCQISNRNATNSQMGAASGLQGTSNSAGSVSTGTEDTTAALNLTITGTLGNAADTLQIESVHATLYPKG